MILEWREDVLLKYAKVGLKANENKSMGMVLGVEEGLIREVIWMRGNVSLFWFLCTLCLCQMYQVRMKRNAAEKMAGGGEVVSSIRSLVNDGSLQLHEYCLGSEIRV